MVDNINVNTKLKENIIALFTLKGAEYIVSFITLPYLLHILGPDKFGAIIFMQSLIVYGNIIVDFGFNLTAPRDIAQAKIEEIPKQFSTILLAKGILFLASVMVGGGIIYLFKDSIDILLLICTLPSFIGNFIFPIWYYQGIQKMRFITYFNIISRILSVLGIFIFVTDKADYCIAALLQSSVPLISGILSLAMLLATKRMLFCMPSKKDVFNKYRDGWDIFISTFFINLYTNTNIVILRWLTNDTCVGIYAAANKIIEVLKGVMMPISNAIFPHVSILVKKSHNEAIIFLNKLLKIIAFATAILSIFMLLFADFVVDCLMGNDYARTVVVLRIISILPFIIGLSNVFGIQTMVAFGMQRLFSKILMRSAVLNFLLVIPMVYFFQEVGMSITVVIVECFVTSTMYFNLHKKNIF